MLIIIRFGYGELSGLGGARRCFVDSQERAGSSWLKIGRGGGRLWF
jgi:hypothetical protein